MLKPKPYKNKSSCYLWWWEWWDLNPHAFRHKNLNLACTANFTTFPLVSIKWRRMRDSDPRRTCALNGFQDRRFQPLSQLSILYQSHLHIWHLWWDSNPQIPPWEGGDSSHFVYRGILMYAFNLKTSGEEWQNRTVIRWITITYSDHWTNSSTK